MLASVYCKMDGTCLLLIDDQTKYSTDFVLMLVGYPESKQWTVLKTSGGAKVVAPDKGICSYKCLIINHKHI